MKDFFILPKNVNLLFTPLKLLRVCCISLIFTLTNIAAMIAAVAFKTLCSPRRLLLNLYKPEYFGITFFLFKKKKIVLD